jgi:hypothetical protein
MSDENKEFIELIGSVKRVTFHSSNTGWTVLRFIVKGNSEFDRVNWPTDDREGWTVVAE